MSPLKLGRARAPVAVATLASFIFSLVPIRVARADEEPTPATAALATTPDVAAPASSAPMHKEPTSDAMRALPQGGPQHVADSNGGGPGPVTPTSLPGGADKTGVSSQAIALPQGSGKIQGMGESFSTQMSTGVATFNVPFALMHARGGAQPSLGLSYSSASGHGVAGVGWDVGVPFISRQTDRGLPHYDDRASWHANQDRFVFNGGQELVPICVVSDGQCANALANEIMPSWAAGWQYFRARVEGSYLRFFWSTDHRTWRVQSKSGEEMELGVPLDGSSDQSALETDPATGTNIFRWNLARQYDAQRDTRGAPVNIVAYRYMTVGGAAYLTDIYDTPPASGGSVGALSQYAHHARLAYDTRPDATFSFRRGWRVDSTQRLSHVDVSSKTFSGGVSGPRHQVRRYHLSYDASYHASLLASVQLEGRCSGDESAAPAEDNSGRLPEGTSCGLLPPMSFGYQHVTPMHADGTPGVADLPGFEGFDERVQTMAGSPRFSLDDDQTDLFDINSDGLPDVLATQPAYFGGNHGVYFNGFGGTANKFGTFSLMPVNGVLGADANIIKLSNFNVTPHDIDGDGTIDLLHMPMVKTYAVYTPQRSGTSWVWQGRVVTTASRQSPKINFQQDRGDIRVMDVNGDGLVDVVYSAGTQYQTFFALGRYPGGDGQYGHATWAPATTTSGQYPTASVVNDPVTACVPWSGGAVRFSDPDVKLADMNGDGLADIVRVRLGDIRYWPGRGNGFWGTGNADDCPAGTSGQDRSVVMTQGPEFDLASADGLRLDDVNGDGLDDLVQVRFNAVDIWLNVDGASWTPMRHTVRGAPISSFANRVRLADLNGSGTRDVVYGDGSNYRYIDLLDGRQPRVLNHVVNGLGKTTEIEYTTSTAQMLVAELAGQPWQSKSPLVHQVVSRVTDRDNLQIVGRPPGVYVTEYTYRDPVYDGRQREFRGFKSSTAKRVGDANSPTSISSSVFLLGECKDDESPPPGVTSRCAPDGRWADNPREALKGLPVLNETYDENGVYASTVHHTYRLRKLYTGLDGREVRVAFESSTDSYAYDTAPFAKSESTVTLTDVELETTIGQVSTDTAPGFTIRAAAGRAHTRGSNVVDSFGNATTQMAEGCVETSSACPTIDEVIYSVTTPARVPGDSSGWLWRTVDAYVQGGDGVHRKHTIMTHDGRGNLTGSQAVLADSLPLDRVTMVGAPGASSDRTIVVSAQEYDAFGNVTASAAPNSRCRAMSYLSDYSDLVTAETVYVGLSTGGTCGRGLGAAGSIGLVAHAAYDRGIGAVSTVFDLHMEKTAAAYDEFGRIVQLYKPSPTAIGSTSSLPAIVIDYDLATSTRPYSIVHTKSQDGPTDADASYQNAYAFADGLGRAIVTFQQADRGAGDKGDWTVNGLTEYDNKGAPRRAFLAWFSSTDPISFSLSTVPPTAYSRQRYDAFGRQVQTFGLDGGVILQSAYHALGVDKWDAADLQPGLHQGTYASARTDGHGRAVSLIERVRVGGAIEQRETQTVFMSTGEPRVITRTRGGDRVVRWLRYDTLGRMVLNVEPNTTKNFKEDPNSDPSALKAWRYSYDDNGDLVGTSDARGCGSNYLYDTAGRILAEDYLPCQADHQSYSPPNLATGDGAEVFYRYDTPDPTAPTTIDDCTINTALVLGRLVSVSDRASKTLTSFDGRGRATCVARQVAKPGTPDVVLANRYAPRFYTQRVAYDAADRPVETSTGAKVLLGANNQSFVTTTYTKRGALKAVGSSYGDLVTAVTRDADGPVTQIVYGDLAGTTTSMSYDQRRRLASVQTYRGPPALWSQQPAAYTPAPDPGGSPSTFQRLLEDVDFLYDVVDNPVEIRDWRDASEWPDGAKPVTRKMQYDDLYRLTRIDYQYAAGDDTWVSPFAAENGGDAKQQDPRRAKPSPHLAFAKRVLSQSFQYDWLGNTARTDDDAKGFYDRSLGAITNGTPGAGPYQLRTAAGGAGQRDGSLTTKYDDAGNLVGLSIARNAHAPCLGGASCSARYAYDWDEVGRMSRARRWDGAGLGTASDPLPLNDGTPPAVDLRFAYDVGDARVLKTAVDTSSTSGDARHSVYVFGGLELRRTPFDGTDYERSTFTEVAYLFANGVRLARLHYATSDVPTLTSGNLHVFLELQDHLGSSSIVLDRATGELAEASTYQAYGAPESDYRPERWDAYRDDYRFTGKEDDIEVGLTYFGKRYYAPLLGHWVSPDPLAVHGLGADLNVYAYVHGGVLRATDPTGLADAPVGNAVVDRHTNAAEVTNGSASDPVLVSREFVGPLQPGVARVNIRSAQVGAQGHTSTHHNPTTPVPNIGAAGAAPMGQFAGLLGSVFTVKAEPEDIGASAYNAVIDESAYGTVAAYAGGPLTAIALSGVIDSATDPIKMDTPEVVQGNTTLDLSRPIGKGIVVATTILATEGLGLAAEGSKGVNVVCPCFAAGTLVAVPDGFRPIESIGVGALVMATDPDTGIVEPKRVLQHFETPRREVIELRVDTTRGSQTLVVTPGHPFWVMDRGWVPAAELALGESLRTLQGTAIVSGLASIGTWTTVHNLDVEDSHTYSVADVGIVVHNGCNCGGSGAGGFAGDAHPTFGPGPHAGESLPVDSTAQVFTAAQRVEGNRIMAATGCHTCGTKNPGTISGNAVLDHQPVSALNFGNLVQRLFPQCLQCSTDQGLATAKALTLLKRSQ